MQFQNPLDRLKPAQRPYAIGAAVVVVLLALWGLASRNASAAPLLKVAQKNGEVAFSANGKVWEVADPGTLLPQGSLLRANEGANAMVQTQKGSYIRLGSNTQFEATGLTQDSLRLTQFSGKTFQRIQNADKSYEVSALGHLIRAHGAAFEISVNATQKRINVKIFEGEANIIPANMPSSSAQTLAKGKEVTIDSKGNMTVADIATSYAGNEWFLWNQAEDDKMGYELKIALAGNAPSESAPTTTAAAPTTTTTTTTKPNTTTTTTTTTTTKIPAPTYTAGSCKPYLSLKRGLNNMGIQLNWSLCKSTDFQFYKVVRSTTNATPSYPSTPALVTSSNSNFGSYLDKNIALGQTYYYRVCVVERLNQIGCGNVAKMAN